MTDQANKKEYSFEEKVEILKKKTAHYHKDAKLQITQWEDEMARLTMQKDWVNHPDTKKLRAIAEEQISAIVSELSSNENLTDVERQAYFKLKNAHIAYLSVLTEDPTSEIETIEEAIANEL